MFGGLSVADFVRQLGATSHVWSTAFAAAFLLAAGLLTYSSWFGDIRSLRPLAGVLAGVYLLGVLTFVPVLTRQGMGGPDAVPWFTTLMVIGTSAATVWLPPAAAWVYLGVSGGLIAVDRLAYGGSGAGLATVQGTLFQLFFCGVFVALALASRHLGQLLDVEGAAAEADTRRSAAQNARTRERRRIDALMHDHVLSVLLASAVGGNRRLVADQASRALRQIERYGADGDPEPVTAAQLVWELQSISTEIAPGAEFRYELQGTTPPPPEIIAAVTEATAEALRNSVIHADPAHREASRAVHVRLDDGGIAVLVLDDGVGFDSKSVPATRLGVSVSIVGRMRGLPGGYAAIESALGRGTTVRIGWMGP